jgi:hypothetical protein
MSKCTRKIYDSVHGFIRFNELERELIDSAPFQRLHQIRQLGIAYLVYPGATHSRFEHSLGVMELATQMYDRIIDKCAETLKVPNVAYWRQIVRFAALCHDLGHLPFSHVAEHLVLSKGGHERWTLDVICSPFLRPIWQQMQKQYPKHDVVSDVSKMALGEEKLLEVGVEETFSSWEKVLSQVVTGDFFGADRIDYLLRDAQCTGVSYGLFDYHQLIEMLCALPSLRKGGQLELGIEENGIQSCEALLLARHFMHKRVYQYPSVKAYSFHLAHFMKKYYDREKKLKTLRDYLSLNDADIISAFTQAAGDRKHFAHLDALCLTQREHRYKAIEIPQGMSVEKIEKWQKKAKIPKEALSWTLSAKPKESRGLSFPVLCRNAKVAPASRFSEIVIPSGSVSWMYIAPKYEESARLFLES